MLFWSDRAYASQCAREEWSNYVPTEALGKVLTKDDQQHIQRLQQFLDRKLYRRPIWKFWHWMAGLSEDVEEALKKF